MNTFLQKFANIVKGTLTGFDRIVFKGYILPLMNEKGVTGFCQGRGILNKDYKTWMMKQTGKVVEAAEHYAQSQCDSRITPILSSRERKEEIAHKRQQEKKITEGPIGVWSATESCFSFKARYCETAGFPQLRGHWTKCKHLYFYFDHKDYGFMNIRLQTWFPYHIQIAMNGREWLRRSLEKEGCEFQVKGNKFQYIADYEKAQSLLDSQLDTQWPRALGEFLPVVFPAMEEILGPHLSYYWTLWQSEWATDFVFPSPGDLEPISDMLLRHAFMTGTSARVLRYLDRPLTKAGVPHANNKNEVMSRLLEFADGLRVRHWVDHNSVKVYTESNNLRVETTINQPGMFQVHRRAQGEPDTKPKRRLPLRKGVADIPLRAAVSQEINDRLIAQLATCREDKPASEVFDAVSQPLKKQGRRVRALDLLGKDRALLEILSDPEFAISGITNKALRKRLCESPGYSGRSEKQQRGKVTRSLRLLRDHGLIRKMPRQFKYQLTTLGRELTTTMTAALVVSTQQLMEMAA